VLGSIPVNCAFDGGGVIPTGLPTKPVVGLINLQVQQVGFVGGAWITCIYPTSLPMLKDRLNQLAYRPIARKWWPEIKGFARRIWFAHQCFRQPQITR
jgi:hypothetical protein